MPAESSELRDHGRQSGGSFVPAAAIAGVLYVCCLAAATSNSWYLLGVSGLGLSFPDLRAVTANAECLASFDFGAGHQLGCDPLGRPYNYPSFWIRSFAALGLGETDTWAVGLVLITIFCSSVLVVGLIARMPSGMAWTAPALAFSALSPPTMLLLERGNIDALVFSLLVAAALALLSERAALAGLLIGAAGILKVFPLGSAVALVCRTRNYRGLFVLSAVAGLGLLVVGRELRGIAEATPVECGASFGAGVVPACANILLDLGLDPLEVRLSGLGLSLALVGLLMVVLHSLGRDQRDWGLADLANRGASDKPFYVLFCTGTGSFLVAYAVGTNWDYRLVFLILTIAALGRFAARGSLAARLLVLALIGQMWVSYLAPEILQIMGDLAWIPLVAILVTLLVGVISTGSPVEDSVQKERSYRRARD